ncbi:hypothetical protein RRG08_043486 [Elysia crispata]|uniref:Uncharacterized protein n=1 Tax=Elysia crispata TaxID=231223 RepID=A0AAE0YFH5_9GAST|nr:hypothetical protein RRG08_043486 [Elysia crispata]
MNGYRYDDYRLQTCVHLLWIDEENVNQAARSASIRWDLRVCQGESAPVCDVSSKSLQMAELLTPPVLSACLRLNPLVYCKFDWEKRIEGRLVFGGQFV